MRETRFDHFEPIVDDDATIAAALEHAHIPSLIMALVHLTGDMDLLRGDVRPSSDLAVFLSDPQGGVSPADQARIRMQALEALKAYRDGGNQPPPRPSMDTVREMTNFLVGQSLPGDYVDFLVSELALDGSDPYGVPMDDVPVDVRRDFHVVVVGAGMSGLLAGIRLREAGISFTIVDKNADVGGTWFENTYPGCRVDSPNHTYSYSFEPNDWPQHFSQQAVLREYFSNVATRYGLREHIRLETEVESMAYDDATRHWNVVVRGADGRRETLRANAVITAVGQLNRPRRPDIAGRDRFTGIAFHSARWQHGHDLTGKRIAVIGTGASAFQFVPEIAPAASEVVIFQRTPPWVLPTPSYHDDIPTGKHWLLNHVPYYARWYRFAVFWRTSEGLLAMVRAEPGWDRPDAVSAANAQLRALLTANIEAILGDDPELLAKATPPYPPGGKRMLLDNGTWLRTLKRPNVHVVTDAITEITPNGVKTADDTEYAADVMIYGTGFQASDFLMPMRITGADGIDLHAHWNGDPRAHLGITVPGFPNFFCMYGPNTNIVVNASNIFF
jgi:4-hydroxyacetophenone monooxygenase